MSTGFRAPSLAQSYYTSTSSAFILTDTHSQGLLEVGTFNVEHPVAQALGAKELEPEKSYHASTGLSFYPAKNWVLSLDYFYIRVNNRILLSGNVTQNAAVFGQDAVNILQQANIGGARFFTNAVDTETQGIDASMKYEWKLGGGRLDLSALYHYNNTKLIGKVRAPAILGDQGSDIILNRSERVQRLEAGQPQDTVILTANYQHKKTGFLVRLQRYGGYNLVHYLENAEYDQRVSAKWLLDAEVSYRLSKSLNIAVGGHNVTDIYPDTNFSKENDIFSGEGKILPYTPNSPFGFNGAFYYLRLHYNF